MSSLQITRPAERSGAVRPPSADPLARQRRSSPRPARPRPLGASPWPAAPSFFVLRPRPVRRQSIGGPRPAECLVPKIVGTKARLGTGLGTRKSNEINALRRCSQCSHAWRAHVIRARARTCRDVSLFLGTWIQTYNIASLQWVVCSQGCSQGLFGWEQWEQWEQPNGALAVDRGAAARLIKVRAGYADQQPQAGCSRKKFRGSIAAAAGAGRAIERGGQLAGADRGIGGLAPLSGRAIGHVGRAMLEGQGQGVAIARLSGARHKPAQLAARRLVAIVQVDPPGPPIARPMSSRVLALDVDGIWIEHAFPGTRSARASGSSIDRQGVGLEKNRKGSIGQRGPGGICLIQSARAARGIARQGKVGMRAGVNVARPWSRPHEADGNRTLGAVVSGVKRRGAACVEKSAVAA